MSFEKFNITVSENHLFWMFRYCLGRSTYAVADAVDAIHFNWDKIGAETKERIVEEIRQHLEKDRFGSISFACDNDSWRSIIERHKNESS